MSAPNPQAGLEVTTRRTITATTESPDGMTLDELAGLLRRAMAAGMDPHTPIRVRTRAQRRGGVRQRRGGRDPRLSPALGTCSEHLTGRDPAGGSGLPSTGGPGRRCCRSPSCSEPSTDHPPAVPGAVVAAGSE